MKSKQIILISVLLCAVLNYTIPTIGCSDKEHIRNVAIIGAGVSGLCSAKYSIDYGYNVTVYEQTEQIGGIWFYTNETGKEKYGINIHTAMYQGLRTNLPYQAMEFPDFPYPKNITSYPPHRDVLNYLHSYADHFNLKEHIKLSHQVIRVLPIEDGKWEIIVKNLPSNTFETNIYDAVFVCNGHYSKPFFPNISGSNDFKGKMIHSHDFRTAEAYRNKSVLVIGGGNSGTDIVEHLLKTASQITFSRHKRPNETQAEHLHQQHIYSKKVTLQDDVVSFTSTSATFIDGSHQTFDAVIFATGYNYSYFFLSADAGIHVEKKLVQPLYKQIFNINHTTMVFIGTVRCLIAVYDLQVRYALKFISGAKALPSKSEMLAKLSESYPPYSTNYSKMLSEEADIQNIPEVLANINVDAMQTQLEEPSKFRKFQYIIIDKKTFRKINNEN